MCKNALHCAVAGVTVVGFLVAGGCATDVTVVTDKFPLVEQVIGRAKGDEVPLYAPDELRIAEEKLAAAWEAARHEDFAKAARLADEALLDADYARARAATVKARKQADELRGTVSLLQQELEDMPR